MPFFDLSQQPTRVIFPGVTITTAWGDSLMLSFVHFDRAEALVPTHSHPHEQGGMILEGRAVFTIGGEEKTMGPGDIYFVPGNVRHKVSNIAGALTSNGM